MEEAPARQCSKSKCKAILPPVEIDKANTCLKCREKDKLYRRNKRAREKEVEENNKRRRSEDTQPVGDPDREDVNMPAPPDVVEREASDSDKDDEGVISSTKPTEYSDSHQMFCALRDAFDNNSDVNFHGSYTISDDPLVSDKERVQLTIREVWKVSGYRFRVRDNKTMETGYKTRLWCCQDEDRKQKA
ncbi:hypothetical protein B0H11DRAFT_2235701 [Mycena galericulata]|nr:hypothetical protein B0H11DRAFT_2428316 [Mycena galericulata]KAJ7475386.1 hypothetical protein B0H11DRAFT_2235701 [Mycena galericulata]